jgi:hypothetical protein
MCKKLATEILGPNTFKDQEKAMDEGMKFPNDKKLHDAIKQFVTINKNMLLLGVEGEFFTIRELNKQITKMLTPRMKFEYVKLGVGTLNDTKAILVMIG